MVPPIWSREVMAADFLHGNACIVDDRRQPVREEIEVQEVHEKHDPDESSAHSPGLPEELAHRETAETLFMGGERRPGLKVSFALMRLRISRMRSSSVPLRASSLIDSGRAKMRNGTSRSGNRPPTQKTPVHPITE